MAEATFATVEVTTSPYLRTVTSCGVIADPFSVTTELSNEPVTVINKG